MKFRKLRIAWSVGWGILAVLLCVLWVRSYFGRISREILVTPTYRYGIHSLDGTLAVIRERRIFISVEVTMLYDEEHWLDLKTNAGLKVVQGSEGELYSVSISFWLLTLASVAVATIPWFPCHFSLRTLLIATTLVAVVMGLIVWLGLP